MSKFFAAAAMLLAGVGLAGAEEFVGSITKVDGNKIYVIKNTATGKSEPAEMVAADSCKVARKSFKVDPKTKKLEGDPVEGGLTNKLFKKATVTAQITTEGDKVTEIIIINVRSDYEFRAVIKKVDGQKVTLMKVGIGIPVTKGEETTLTARDDVKVLETKRAKEPTPVAGGLKSELFNKNVSAVVIVDDDNKIAEIRVTAGGIVKPPPPAPK